MPSVVQRKVALVGPDGRFDDGKTPQLVLDIRDQVQQIEVDIDAHLAGMLAKSANLADVPSPAAARQNLGAAAAQHAHQQSDIDGLTDALAAKADLVDGFVPTAQIPTRALVTAVPVGSQAAMLALTPEQVQPGDIAIRSDGAGTFMLLSPDPSEIGSWTLLAPPTDSVITVNGQSGAVVLSAADVGAATPAQVASAVSAVEITAEGYAAQAAGSATSAADSATAAAGSALLAGQARTGAETARTGAETALNAVPAAVTDQVTSQVVPQVSEATTAREGAEAARDIAVQAKTDAETARNQAQQAVADANLAIGTVTTGAPGSAADASITGTAPSQVLNLTIPAGAVGPSSDEATLPNMVNLFANPLFTADTNGDGIPDGYTKAGTTWTPSLVDGGPFGARYLHATFIASGSTVALSRSYAVTAGHLYFYGAWVRTTLPDTEFNVFCGTTPEYVAVTPDGAWQLAAVISTGTGTTGNVGVTRGTGQYAAGDTLDLSLPIQIDLTAAFGAGNEPTLDYMVRLMSAVGGFDGRYGVAEADRVARAAVGQRTATSREERAQDGVLRVGSFNCPGYADKSSFGARALMQAIDADIWCLQEMFDRIDQSDRRSVAKILGPMLPYRYWTVTNPAAWPAWDKGRLLASARPLRNSSWVATPAQGVQRSEITHCGRTIAVYNIHLPAASAIGAMTNYANALKSFVDADPTPLKIVAGDWNTPGAQHIGPPVDDSALAAFTGTGWTHVQSSIGWQITSRTDLNYGCIDNVMASPGLRIIGGGVGPSSRVSDHRPIWADIVFD